MKITIATRFHPFSHRLGTKLLLPKSSLALKVYPTRLELEDLTHRVVPFHVDISLTGPVKNFTAEVDLEQGHVRIFGITPKGYFSYVIHAQRDGILISVEKIAEQSVECRHSFSPCAFSFAKGQEILIPLSLEVHEKSSNERLSFGMHKSQEWAGIYRRLDFKEIFPFWHCLSAWIPCNENSSTEGNFQLLDFCQKKVEAREKNAILTAFEHFFLAAFEGILVPRLLDTEFQGILPAISVDTKTSTFSPLGLLCAGGKLIRSLFFQENKEAIAILPCLPAQFHCGRMTGIHTAQGHEIDFEWSKKSLRRLRLIASLAAEVTLKVPKGISSCRVKIGRKTCKHPTIDSQGLLKLSLEKNEVLHLDRFK